VTTHLCERARLGQWQVEGDGLAALCGRLIDGKAHLHVWADQVGRSREIDCNDCLGWLAQWARAQIWKRREAAARSPAIWNLS
jgi:hypothetical protein